ncbi:centrosomal protein of 128 kDa-like isoform X2 [Brienomyrus brachyistius]|uniref:centrosomal protein of 128 kDa-like isoform X2 n=1 Tax=Brienomyrus brachyistius TaxID=42636 RepID=UPI0020B335F1|nr:centrosomal protein of 128 kDa-like isoform X2 [Brienomyrus brachyistius]
MAESSSESDTYLGSRGGPSRGRNGRHKHRSTRPRGDGDISRKIDTLADTLEDTSRNLHNVDRMLGQYRQHTDDQAKAMAALRGDLEDSVQQLRSQRSWGAASTHSPSPSTMHTSDLEAGYSSEGHRYLPTSPLRHHGGPESATRRRSRSTSVRFRDPGHQDIHSLHQSLRDLRSDQMQLGEDVDREILRRNRSDLETRKTLEALSDHLRTSQRDESVSSRVERRLLEMEREMRSSRQALEGRPEPRGKVSPELQEVPMKREKEEEAMKNRLLKSERERSKVEELRLQLARTEKQSVEVQLQASRLLSEQRSTADGGDLSRGLLEHEVQELRRQLAGGGPLREVEELRRTVERKERERAQLSMRVETLSSDLERREQQQLQMLAQLKELEVRSEAEQARVGRSLAEAEAELAQGERRREELRTRAQEAVRQWKGRCKTLERDLEERRREAQRSTDEAQQAAKEKEAAQAQLRALGQQAEGLRKELAEALARLSQREEELRRREEELLESRTRLQSVEREAREAREAARTLEAQVELQGPLRERLREEKRVLEAQAGAERAALLELQGSVRELSAARAALAERLAVEEREEAGLRQRLDEAQKEAASLGQQLRREKELREQESASLRAELRDSEARQERAVLEGQALLVQLEQLKADAGADRELVRAHRRQVERMKAECDKLSEEQARAEEGREQLRRKYQLLKQDLEKKAKLVVRSDDYLRGMDGTITELREQVSRLEAERESVLGAVGAEIDSACLALSRESEKLKAISLNPGLQKDPHRWLAETKTKLQWLREEVKEREGRERKLRRHLQQGREQLKGLKQSRGAEQHVLLERVAQQERLLQGVQGEKRELLQEMRRKDEEMRSLQDRILDLEMSTKLALDHLESVPEKLSLLENIKDLEESQRQREVVEQRYAKYKEIVCDLQRQLEESKRRIQEYRDEKLDAMSRSVRLAAFSSSVGQSSFLSSTLLTDSTSPPRRPPSPGLGGLPEDGQPHVRGAKALLDIGHT